MTGKNPGRRGGLRKWLGLGGASNDGIIQDSSNERREQFGYKVREDFLSEAEISFYRVLRSMASERLAIFPKVSLEDVFSISGADTSIHYQKINYKTVDFLLCDPDSLKPLLAVDFEDSSYPVINQNEKDESVGDVFITSGLPLVRVQAQESYNIPELARAFREAIESTIVNEAASP